MSGKYRPSNERRRQQQHGRKRKCLSDQHHPGCWNKSHSTPQVNQVNHAHTHVRSGEREKHHLIRQGQQPYVIATTTASLSKQNGPCPAPTPSMPSPIPRCVWAHTVECLVTPDAVSETPHPTSQPEKTRVHGKPVVCTCSTYPPGTSCPQSGQTLAGFVHNYQSAEFNSPCACVALLTH